MADSPDYVLKTKAALSRYITKPPLVESTLAKPPFKYLQHIIAVVIDTHGFLDGLYSDDELHGAAAKDKAAKIDFLQKGADAVAFVIEAGLAIRPAKTVAGLEPAETNAFLLSIAGAMDAGLSSTDAVARVRNGERPKFPVGPSPLLSNVGGEKSDSAGSNKENKAGAVAAVNVNGHLLNGEADRKPEPRSSGGTRKSGNDSKHTSSSSKDRHRSGQSQSTKAGGSSKDATASRSRSKDRTSTKERDKAKDKERERQKAKDKERSGDKGQSGSRKDHLTTDGATRGSSKDRTRNSSSKPGESRRDSSSKTSHEAKPGSSSTNANRRGSHTTPGSSKPTHSTRRTSRDHGKPSSSTTSSSKQVELQKPTSTNPEHLQNGSAKDNSSAEHHSPSSTKGDSARKVSVSSTASHNENNHHQQKQQQLGSDSTRLDPDQTSRIAQSAAVQRPGSALRGARGGRPGTAMGRPTTASAARPAPPRLRKTGPEPVPERSGQHGATGAATETPNILIIPDVKPDSSGGSGTDSRGPGGRSNSGSGSSADVSKNKAGRKKGRKHQEDDDIDAFIVEEPLEGLSDDGGIGIGPGGSTGVDANELEGSDHGGLVRKILETKKDLESTDQQQDGGSGAVTTIIFDEKDREKTQKEAAKLQGALQGLTRSSHPLGRIMDFMQEDIDAMMRELERWRAETKQNHTRLREARAVAGSSAEGKRGRASQLGSAFGERVGSADPSGPMDTEGLKTQLKKLDATAVQEREVIVGLKSKIAANEDKCRQILGNVARR